MICHNWGEQFLRKFTLPHHRFLIIILFLCLWLGAPAPGLAGRLLPLPDSNQNLQAGNHASRIVPRDNRVVVLTYHHLVLAADPLNPNPMALPVSEFAWQMGYLHQNGFRSITLSQLQAFLQGETELPERNVLITFDDGYESNYLYAAPVMARYKMHGVIFLIGQPPVINPVTGLNALPHLTSLQLKRLYQSGYWEFGYHTYNHHYQEKGKSVLINLPAQELQQDLQNFQQMIYGLGLPQCRAIAYPFGQYSPTLLQEIERQGYKLGFTVTPGYIRPGHNPLLLNRFTVSSLLTRQQFQAIVNRQVS